jgi:hypothetical protein
MSEQMVARSMGSDAASMKWVTASWRASVASPMLRIIAKQASQGRRGGSASLVSRRVGLEVVSGARVGVVGAPCVTWRCDFDEVGGRRPCGSGRGAACDAARQSARSQGGACARLAEAARVAAVAVAAARPRLLVWGSVGRG